MTKSEIHEIITVGTIGAHHVVNGLWQSLLESRKKNSTQRRQDAKAQRLGIK
jgi:hypothetical protein